MNNIILLIILIILIVVVAVVIIYVMVKPKKYTCINNNCEPTSNGVNLDICKNTCRKPISYLYKNGKCISVERKCKPGELNCYSSLVSCQKAHDLPSQTMYACSGTDCVEDSTGSYTSLDCDNACDLPSQTMYACSGTDCVEDSTGSYTSLDCDNACANKLSISSRDLTDKVQKIDKSLYGVFDAISLFNEINIQKSVLMHYTSVEYDPMQFHDNALEGSSPILKGILKWFTSTLNQCKHGDILLLNADFISMDSNTINTLINKLENGVNVILVVDRWEISGYPLLASKLNQDWSPAYTKTSGCISDDPCKNLSSSFNKYPYGCPADAPGPSHTYCPATNYIIDALSNSKNFYLLDEAATILNISSGTSRNSPWHNHRHVTTFYMKSQSLASIFKGSWNFTGADPVQNNDVPGQKESGFVITADINSDPIQADLIFNYYWLSAMAVFCPASLSPPEKFTLPGNSASPIFQILLEYVKHSRIDTHNDQLLVPVYGGQYELYSITQQDNRTYISGDPSSIISMGYGPPPAPAKDTVGLANPTPWEGKNSTMLNRKIPDGYSSTIFNSIWPVLSCVSNTMQFLYPYTPVYSSNPMPPLAWRVPSGSKALNCGHCASISSDFDKAKIGHPCTNNTDCGGNDGNCVSGYCAFPCDTKCTNCAACGLTDGRDKAHACAVDSGTHKWPDIPAGKSAGCYSVYKDGCEKDKSGNITCSPTCPCYTCSPGPPPPPPPKKCPTINDGEDIGDVCLIKDSNNNLIPSNNCYKINGKNYDCAARVIWAPGSLWIGGLMYKFWKEAGDNVNNKSIYVSMYSSFDDAGTGCILNCEGGGDGAKSAWSTKSAPVITSDQYNFNDDTKKIDAARWYEHADSNSIQDVTDFLTKNGTSLSLLRGQWQNLSAGTDGAFTSFQTTASTNHNTYNMKLYLAQKKQVTLDGRNDTVTTNINPTSPNNPDVTTKSQRNHTKCYISKDSIASCSGHPYNGGVQDWGGINEVMLVENCKNACLPVRSNWEIEYKYGETIENASTFKWAPDWHDKGADSELPDTSLLSSPWDNNSDTGGLISF